MDHKSKKKKKGKEFDRNSKSLKYEMLKKKGAKSKPANIKSILPALRICTQITLIN